MKGVALVVLALLVSQVSAAGFYTGSDGKKVVISDVPNICVVDGEISESDLATILEANFNAAGSVVSSSKKIGLPTLNELEQIVESLALEADGRELAQKVKQSAQENGWFSVLVGQKEGDFYSVAVVNQNGKAVAAEIICNSQVMLTATGPDKAMEIETGIYEGTGRM